MTYPDSVQYLYSLGNEIKSIKLGLERITSVLKALGDPQHAYNVIHVAGTNGKGSVCAMIEAGLRHSGVRTGLYTSPHLIEPTERVRIDGADVTQEQFLAAFDQVHRTAEKLLADGEIDGHPTYFETVTAMAFLIFRDQNIHTLVCEVGLGGRLDATNVVKPTLCVITPIDFDHELYLGNRIEQIAFEKAGILKPGSTAVFCPQRPDVESVLDRVAKNASVAVTRVADFKVSNLVIDAHGCRYRVDRGLFARDLEVECPLAGEHQVVNSLAAALALDHFSISPAGIRETRWPGRLERIRQSPEVILDGAHNPAGARALAQYMERFFKERRLWLVYGTMRDKAIDEIADSIFPLAGELILTAPNFERALYPRSLAPHYPKARIAQTLTDALAIVKREASPDDVVFITGSLFLVGEARALLTENPGIL